MRNDDEEVLEIRPPHCSLLHRGKWFSPDVQINLRPILTKLCFDNTIKCFSWRTKQWHNDINLVPSSCLEKYLPEGSWLLSYQSYGCKQHSQSQRTFIITFTFLLGPVWWMLALKIQICLAVILHGFFLNWMYTTHQVSSFALHFPTKMCCTMPLTL